MYKRKEVTPEWVESLKFGELSDLDTSHAVLKRAHTLAFTGSKWVAFADPVQQIGWLIDIKIISPHVANGKGYKVRKVVNSGTRLCSYIPRQKKKQNKNIIIEEAQYKCSYLLKTSNITQSILKMVSEFSPAGFIGLGFSTSTIFLEIKGARHGGETHTIPLTCMLA